MVQIERKHFVPENVNNIVMSIQGGGYISNCFNEEGMEEGGRERHFPHKTLFFPHLGGPPPTTAQLLIFRNCYASILFS